MNPFAALSRVLHPSPALSGEVQAALSRLANPLKNIGIAGQLAVADATFSRQLAAPVARALDYCDTLVAAVPGLIDIDRRAFATNPLVHALFAMPADIDSMLGRSLDLRRFFATTSAPTDDHLYALLAMRRHEKSTLGIELDGSILRTDVPQKVLYFTDHTLVELGTDLGTTRAKLRLAAFDSLLACFTDHLRAIYQERQSLRDDRALETAHLAFLRGRNTQQEYRVHTRRLGELDQRLGAVADSLQAGPVIEALADFLSNPESSLRLEPIEVCVDRSGIIRSGGLATNAHADLIGFPELVARDRRRYVVVLARFRREDALHALTAIQEQQSRFIII